MKKNINQQDKNNKKRVLMFFVFLILLTIIIASLIEPKTTQFKEDEKHFSSLPEEFNNFKIGFISDVHVDSQRDFEALEKRLKTFQTYNCDIILLGGDYSDSLEWQEKIFKLFGTLKAQHGVFAVRGNHDTSSGTELFKVIEKNNITLLNYQNAKIKKNNASINIIGSDDYYSEYLNPKLGLRKALKNINIQDFSIMIAHNPKTAALLKEINLDNCVDITLSGHTHGGQITFFGLYSPMAKRNFPAYSNQWVSKGQNVVLFSNGMGEWLPLRFFAKPQAHIITLKRKQ